MSLTWANPSFGLSKRKEQEQLYAVYKSPLQNEFKASLILLLTSGHFGHSKLHTHVRRCEQKAFELKYQIRMNTYHLQLLNIHCYLRQLPVSVPVSPICPHLAVQFHLRPRRSQK